MRKQLAWYRLSFPRDLDEGAASAALASLSGIASWARIAVEVVGSSAGIEHRLGVTASDREIVAAELRAASGSIRLDPIDVPVLPPALRVLWQTTPRIAALRTDMPEATAASLLSSLFPMRDGEAVRLRWWLRSGRRPRVDFGSEAPRDGRVLVIRKKLAQAGLNAYGELAVSAPTRKRASYLMQRTAAVLRGLSLPHGHLVADPPVWGTVAYWFGLRGRYLSVAELTAVIGWPIGSAERLPGLALGSARRLPPSAVIPYSGRVIGRSDYVGLDRPVALPVAAATRHTYLLGPTGTGKTSLIQNLIVQDMAAGRGLAVVDTNGDLSRSLTDLVPPDRFEDVVYLDPADTSPVGLNPLLVVPGMSPDLVADQLVELFHRVWQSFWGPRSAHLFHLGLATLARQPDATLVDLPRIFTDENFRRQGVGRLNDPVGLGAGWAWFESVPERDRLTMLGPVFNKVWALTARQSVRDVLGQARPRITLSSVLAERKILIVNLAKGILGGEAARLFGALIVTGIWQAATQRATLEVDQRPTFMVYLDELQDLLAVPVPFDEMLSQGRKYGLALNLAHQNLGQLDGEVREAILANSHTKISFRVEPSDARVMARTFEPFLDAQDLQAMGAYEAAAIIGLERGGVAPPVTFRTLPPPQSVDSAEWVTAISRRLYGTPADEVEAELRGRQLPPQPPSAPVGRKRRSP